MDMVTSYLPVQIERKKADVTQAFLSTVMADEARWFSSHMPGEQDQQALKSAVAVVYRTPFQASGLAIHRRSMTSA